MQREDDFFHSPGAAFWFGVCEARDDPAMMGRIRVRIFGYHSPDRTEIPTETLPWASIMLPTTAAGMSGVMSTASSIMEGAWVIGFFRDGPSAQDPVVIGVLMGMSSPRWTGISGSAPSEAIEQASSQLIASPPAVGTPKQELTDKIEKQKPGEIFDKIKKAWDESILGKKIEELRGSFPDLREIDSDVLKDAIKTTQETDDATLKEVKTIPDQVSTDIKELQPDSLEAAKKLTPEQQQILKEHLEQK
jgi:hypothetical protein